MALDLLQCVDKGGHVLRHDILQQGHAGLPVTRTNRELQGEGGDGADARLHVDLERVVQTLDDTLAGLGQKMLVSGKRQTQVRAPRSRETGRVR